MIHLQTKLGRILFACDFAAGNSRLLVNLVAFCCLLPLICQISTERYLETFQNERRESTALKVEFIWLLLSI